jgi:hypothetical protein
MIMFLYGNMEIALNGEGATRSLRVGSCHPKKGVGNDYFILPPQNIIMRFEPLRGANMAQLIG